jgi:hypothetical protein
LGLVVLVIFGGYLANLITEPTVKADFSYSGYSLSSNSPWLENSPVGFTETLKNSYFISADSSILSLLYPKGENFVYFAKRGETFSSIASKLGLEAGVLQKANPKIKRLNSGQEIIIPISGN